MSHEITNDMRIDAIKDNFTPPTELDERQVAGLLKNIGLSYENFFSWIKKNGEYMELDGIISFWTYEVARYIKENVQLLEGG